MKKFELKWWQKDRLGWPIETCEGTPIHNFCRIVCQNIRKVENLLPPHMNQKLRQNLYCFCAILSLMSFGWLVLLSIFKVAGVLVFPSDVVAGLFATFGAGLMGAAWFSNIWEQK